MTDEPKTEPPKRKRRKLSRKRKIIFALFAMFVGLLFTEGVLQIAAVISPKIHYAISDDRVPANIEDETLGVRPNPDAPEHDSAGWRNVTRPDTANIVCIGDSQTYGTSCRREEAWPLVLGDEAELVSYSMAYGSYGPTHHLSLTPEALKLEPDLLIVAIYSGNDLADCYRMVYWPERGSMPELKSDDPVILAGIETVNNSGRDFQDGWNDLQAIVDPPSSNEPSFRSKLSKWFRLYGVVRSFNKYLRADEEAAKANDPERIEKKWQKRKKLAEQTDDPDTLFIYEQGDVRTLLTPRTRGDIMALDDARIEEGLRLAKVSLTRIIEATEGKTKLAVVFIPTKELVFYEAATSTYGHASPVLDKLVADETELWSQLRTFLDDKSVPYIDTLPALRGLLGSGVNPYPEQWDGHPNAAGNEVMAKLIADSAPVKAAKAGG